MSYFSQTDKTDIEAVNTTSSKLDSPVVVGGVVFTSGSSVRFSKGGQEKIIQENRQNLGFDELSKEEEDRFYKKVFQTSLI